MAIGAMSLVDSSVPCLMECDNLLWSATQDGIVLTIGRRQGKQKSCTPCRLQSMQWEYCMFQAGSAHCLLFALSETTVTKTVPVYSIIYEPMKYALRFHGPCGSRQSSLQRAILRYPASKNSLCVRSVVIRLRSRHQQIPTVKASLEVLL